MDVVLWYLGDVKIDHMTECFHIDPTRCYICGDQDAEVTTFEPGERLGSLRLRAITVDTFRRDPFTVEQLCEPVSPMLGACEYQSVVYFTTAEELDQKCTLETPPDMICYLFDSRCWGSLSLKRDFDRSI